MEKMLYLLLFSSTFCFAQDKEAMYKDIDLYNKGIAIYELSEHSLKLEERIAQYDSVVPEEDIARQENIRLRQLILEKACSYFNDIVKKPESEFYHSALLKKAEIEDLLGKISAKQTFTKLFNESKGEHYYYKLAAMRALAEIETEEGNYLKSIEYLDLLQKDPTFRPSDFFYTERKLLYNYLYAQNYAALNQPDKALQYALPLVLGTNKEEIYPLARLAASILKNKYGFKNAKELFNKASQNILFRTEKDRGYFYISFLKADIEIQLPSNVEPITEKQRYLAKAAIEGSDFYRLLNGSLL